MQTHIQSLQGRCRRRGSTDPSTPGEEGEEGWKGGDLGALRPDSVDGVSRTVSAIESCLVFV